MFFDSIYLVDSFRNEPLSNGFVKFSIQQKKDNPLETRIENKASIYFDKNEPVVTNTVFHTIGEEFIEIKLISSTFNTQFNVKSIKVFPNPFREKTQIILDSDELENPSLMLINMQGQIVKVISSINKNTFNIEREDLSNGMYLFKIMEGDKEVGNGKIIVQ
ncbi:MAG: T9SS type A sorting domain-containing protein [Bacteroidetes bacterium]|nr:T9SS type A sorting domain-containing protein [Bacteroidota bacterium]